MRVHVLLETLMSDGLRMTGLVEGTSREDALKGKESRRKVRA